MTVFLITIIIYFMTAGVFFLRSISRGPRVESDAGVSSLLQPGRPSEGEKIFRENCQSCHSLDDEAGGIGPSLKGIFKKETLPSSGRPSVPPNIIRQLRTPVGTMPAFPQLTEKEIADLLAYFINL
jgi:mono/diheme cytochrome c family protein